MAQLSLRERLQPALFDRLIDDERVLTCYEFAFRRDELTRLGIKERELASILTAQGLREVDGDASFQTEGARSDQNLFCLMLVAPGGKVSPSSLKTLQLKPP